MDGNWWGEVGEKTGWTSKIYSTIGSSLSMWTHDTTVTLCMMSINPSSLRSNDLVFYGSILRAWIGRSRMLLPHCLSWGAGIEAVHWPYCVGPRSSRGQMKNYCMVALRKHTLTICWIGDLETWNSKRSNDRSSNIFEGKGSCIFWDILISFRARVRQFTLSITEVIRRSACNNQSNIRHSGQDSWTCMCVVKECRWRASNWVLKHNQTSSVQIDGDDCNHHSSRRKPFHFVVY